MTRLEELRTRMAELEHRRDILGEVIESLAWEIWTSDRYASAMKEIAESKNYSAEKWVDCFLRPYLARFTEEEEFDYRPTIEEVLKSAPWFDGKANQNLGWIMNMLFRIADFEKADNEASNEFIPLDEEYVALRDGKKGE